jgi:hypothetical protein
MASQAVIEAYTGAALEAANLYPDVFLSEFVQIQTVHGRQPFKLRWYQKQLLVDFQLYKYNLVLKARQLGFTTLISGYSLWLALFREDQVIDIFADKELNAKKIIKRLRYQYRSMPQWLKDTLPKPIKTNETNWTWENGSSVEAFTATEDSGRGETANLAILDEWASYPAEAADDAWAAIEPTIDIGGIFIGGSTAKGIENAFHNKWQGIEGDPEWRRTFVPYNVVPHRNHLWWEAKLKAYQREGTEWIIHQEYPRTAEEAFVKSGQNVFDTEILMAAEPAMRPPIERGYMDPKGHFIHNNEGPLAIWQMPVMGASYVIGADVAEGLERGDFSDACVIAARDIIREGHTLVRGGEVVARYRCKHDTDLYADALVAVAEFYQGALVGVERNGPGLAVVNRLRDKSYPRLYRQEILDQRTRQLTERIGWQTSRTTKPLIIEELVTAVRKSEIVFWDELLRREMMTFVRDERGLLGKPTIKDDAVMSCAIAWRMVSHAFEPRYAPRELGPPDFSFAWFAQQAGIESDPTKSGPKQEAWI